MEETAKESEAVVPHDVASNTRQTDAAAGKITAYGRAALAVLDRYTRVRSVFDDVRADVHEVRGELHRAVARVIAPHEPRENAKTEPQPRKRAVIIGINYYNTHCELHGCVNDAKRFKRALVKYYGFDKRDIFLLTDKPGSDPDFIPTRVNILAALRAYADLTCPGDTLVVMYSGHGSQIVCTDHDEDMNPDTPGMDDVICPCDFEQHRHHHHHHHHRHHHHDHIEERDENDTHDEQRAFIKDDDLKAMLVDPLPPGAKLRVFLDCCNSGTGLDLPYLFVHGEEFVNIADTPQIVDAILISGCRDDQTSADACINQQPTGALTWALLKGLETSRVARMTWKDLHTLVRANLIEAGYEQVPVLSVGDKRLVNTLVDL